MRKFKLINANNAEFDFMRTDAFLQSPDGFGFGTDVETQRVGNEFAVTKTEEVQPTPSGEIVFAGYEQLYEFRQFCREGGLVLAYMPQATWYYLDVELVLSVEEIDERRRLVCPVEFTGLSMWYESEIVKHSEDSSTAGKIYPYTYDFTYAESVQGDFVIYNDGLPCYFVLEMAASASPLELTNPEWLLIVDGKVQKTGRLVGTFRTGLSVNGIVVDTDPAELAIYKQNAGGTNPSLYAYSDFSTERFFEIPHGESIIRLRQSGPVIPSGRLTIKKRR